MRTVTYLIGFTIALFVFSCNEKSSLREEAEKRKADSLERVKRAEEEERKRPRTAADIKLTKKLAFDKYTLDDEYPYKDTTRVFQWDKIKEKLAHIDNFQREKKYYAVLQNYKNRNGEAPVVANYVRNAYKRVSDTLGTERYQSVPLYQADNDNVPILYGRDGSLVELLSSDTIPMIKVAGLSFDGTWEVPKRYVKTIGDTVTFNHVVVVDVTNQNICTIERSEETSWRILSMNPATSGMHKPPYSMETPTGIFVLQEKKPKMRYLKDGTKTIQGYAPYANRFTNGGYIHGIPTQSPNARIIEYSASLGTVPRSHMCVRNASSHAKFIYDWAKTLQSLIIVID
ncbi:L,D-transpeptidase [Parapedobacter indicus]|uniref:Lipoprotein-anchoring transpeptidase ErfK/SrfK n=1 Tax=Parapedobacter indicus TaxID=1477437 RepID=A0A1I3JW51_9SPHI|nr:L,D-transpeptidase family protein [Parapedobacter indicus]PPL01629.1 lipoprotein-anchoring transpeptidase ErfK/SrfK [Parapedobacter indicus]SFI64453.1 Lipoprotein-anchoring transpeptidase ErfK/SrfK [Parapedobacter indicus]